MSIAPVTIGDIAGVIAALAFAYLVWRLGSVVGKAGEILDETRIGVKGLADGSVPLLGEVTTTVCPRPSKKARNRRLISAVSMVGPCVRVTVCRVLTGAVKVWFGGGQRRGGHAVRLGAGFP